MKLFTYRGQRVRIIHRKIKGVTWLILWSPFLFAIGIYTNIHLEELKIHPLPQAYFIGAVFFSSSILAWFINQLCYEKFLFFQKMNSLRILSRFLLENNLYLSKKIKRENKISEKIELPQVYLKQSPYKIEISFILEGNKFQDRFLNLGSTLEVMFNGDFRNKTFDKRFIKYEIAINRIDSRISIDNVTVKGSKLQLMKDVTWDFIEEPHLLIGGGTGGGKTVVLMTIIYALAKIGFIDICDPKNSDLAGLKKIPVFHNRVFTSKEDIINCFKENVEFMEKRYQLISSSPKFQAGKNFKHYDMKPKFILVESTGYDMMFGDANKTKEFKKLDEINGIRIKGRGYIANNGELAGEFFSPYVPLDQGFSFYEAYSQIPVIEFEGEEFSVFEEFQSQTKTKKETQESDTELETTNRTLKDFSDEYNLKMATLRKIIYLLEEEGMTFERSESAILVEPFQEKLLLEILSQFDEDGRKSYPKAVQAIINHHGLGQGQGQA